MDAILEHLRNRGPVVIGSDWTDDMFDTDANGFVVPDRQRGRRPLLPALRR